MKFFPLTFLSLFLQQAAAQQHYLLAGTYDSPKSEGIYVYQFNSRNGRATEVSHINTSNPSFLTVSPDEKYVYAVSERSDSTGKRGGVVSFSFDKKKGVLTWLNEQSSQGNNPCYIDIHPSGKWLATGNYSSGSLAVYPLLADGLIGNFSDTIQHSGRSLNEARQKGPHVHATVFTADRDNLVVTDLGIDKVFVYPFDREKGILERKKTQVVYVSPGFGPRHIAFSPDNKFIYLVNELSSMVDVFSFKKGKLISVQTESTLPADSPGPAGSADIHVSPDGKFLYVSNRGESNTIAIFSIDSKNGTITRAGYQPTLGKTPRNFNFDPTGKFLLVANQNSDEIVIFKRDLKTGLLSDTGNRVSVGKPVCIKWITIK
ncbi:MAG: lactonase family protein [Bacteroidota bacterium]